MREVLAGLVAVAALGGCSLVSFDPTPDPEAGPGLVGDCTPPFVLDEETTLGALGIAQFEGMGVALGRRGSVRITEATMRWEDFAPPDAPPLVAEGQLLCVTWPDGSGLTTLLEEPFGQGVGPVAPADGGDGPPVALLLAAFAVIVLGGVSWLAFRREPPPGD